MRTKAQPPQICILALTGLLLATLAAAEPLQPLPAALVPFVENPAEAYLRWHGCGDTWWLPADAFYAEPRDPRGVWVRGELEGEALLLRKGEETTLAVSVSSPVVGNTFSVSVGERRLEVSFAVAGARQRVPVVLDLSEGSRIPDPEGAEPAEVTFYRVRLGATGGLVPKERNPRSEDDRYLGTFVVLCSR